MLSRTLSRLACRTSASRPAAATSRRRLSSSPVDDIATSAPVSLRQEYGLWIDNTEVSALAGGLIPVENPATTELVTYVAEAREADVKRAIASASEAHADGRWSNMEARERGRVLNKAADILRGRISELAELETLCTGRCLREYKAQLGRVPEWFEYFAAVAQSTEVRTQYKYEYCGQCILVHITACNTGRGTLTGRATTVLRPRSPVLRAACPTGCVRPHHAVEPPASYRGQEARGCSGGGEHMRRQAAGVGPGRRP
jgi:hypothetical protein